MPRPERGAAGHRPSELVRRLLDADSLRRRGSFLVEGVRFVIEAAAAGQLLELVVSDRLLTHVAARQLWRRARRDGIPCHRVTPEDFRGLSRARHACGIAALVSARWHALEALTPTPDACWVALRGVRSPGNLGTILRTADAVGARGLIALDDGVDPFAPGVVRGSMGAVFRLTFARAAPAALRAWVQAAGARLIALTPGEGARYDQARWSLPIVLLLGEEGHGLTAEDRALCDELVHIPMRAPVDSLNLGVAASLALYEVFRQRRQGCFA